MMTPTELVMMKTNESVMTLAKNAWARRDEHGGGKAGALATLTETHNVPGPGPCTGYGWSAAPALVALAAEQIVHNSGSLGADL